MFHKIREWNKLVLIYVVIFTFETVCILRAIFTFEVPFIFRSASSSRTRSCEKKKQAVAELCQAQDTLG